MSPDKPRPQSVRASLTREEASGHYVERSAGGVVVRVVDGQPLVLLIRDPYRKWGLPKGHLEEGEEFRDAALREVKEETGLESLELGPDLGEIDWVFRKGGRLVHKFCRFYLMASELGEARPQLSEGITECRWLPLDTAVRMVAYDNARSILRRGVERLREPTGEDVPVWRDG